MERDASVLSLRKRIGIAATAVALLHVILSIIFLLSPKAAQHSGTIGLMYNRLMLIGPFFNEPRIKTSPHLYIRYYENDQWTPVRDVAAENHALFIRHPWRYDRLRINYFERYITRQAEHLKSRHDVGSVKESRAFRELNQFVLREYIQRPVDSVSLVYGVSQYDPETNSTRFDTTFAYTYKPSEIDLAKEL
jgi:hypothetical protein